MDDAVHGEDGVQVAGIASELAALHRSLGMRRTRLGPSVGPLLRGVLGLAADAPESELRLRLADALIGAAQGLPSDSRLAFLNAAALTNENRLLQDRLVDVGRRIDRDARTVRRRLDEANHAVARILLQERVRRANNPMAPTGWTVLAMDSELDLRLTRPTFTSRRTMLVGEPLTSITETFSIPRPESGPAEDVCVDALAGGQVVRLDRLADSVWRFQLDLGRRLMAGDSHELTVRVTVPSHEFMAPYNVVVPYRPCAYAACKVWFDADRMPPLVRRLEGMPTSVLMDKVTPAYAEPPAQQRMSAEFSGLVPGLAYGFVWTPLATGSALPAAAP